MRSNERQVRHCERNEVKRGNLICPQAISPLVMGVLALLFIIAWFPSLPGWSETIEEGLFLIEYDPDDEAMAQRAARVLSESLETFPEHLEAGAEPIRVLICGTPESFARVAGRYAAAKKVGGIAKPDDSFIAVKTPNLMPGLYDFDGTLRHELVHILLARNYNVDEIPRWLNEGIAMALAREHRWGSVYHVGIMYLQGRIISYRELMWAFHEPGREMEFGNAYAQSLLMTRYLMERTGEDAFWDLLRDVDDMRFGQAMEKHLDMIPPEFLDAWVQSLWSLALIVSIVSGIGLFQVGALLLILAYLRKRRRNQRVLERWEEEDREDEEYGPVVLPWELETGETGGPWDDYEGDDED